MMQTHSNWDQFVDLAMATLDNCRTLIIGQQQMWAESNRNIG